MLLPQAAEAVAAHRWWDKGQLGEWLGDEEPSPLLRLYVEHVTGALAELELEREAERERQAKLAARRGR